jgi:hypothetical protein
VAKRCHAYLSVQIVCAGQRLILDVQPVYKNNKPLAKQLEKMLSRLRKQGLKIKQIYLDRGFYQVEVLQELREHYASQSLMPAIRTSRVQKAIREWHEEHGFQAGMKELTLGDEKNPQKYILLFAPLDEKKRKAIRDKAKAANSPKSGKKKAKVDKEETVAGGKPVEANIHNFYLFFCLLKIPEIGGDPVDSANSSEMELVFQRLSLYYRKRWGIETGYRVVKTIWAQTTSKEYSLRVWLMWNAVLLYNLWVLESLKLLEDKGIPSNYSCCSGDLLGKPRVEKEARQVHERPKREWEPRPLLTFSSFLRIVNVIAEKEIVELVKVLKIDDSGGNTGNNNENVEESNADNNFKT